MGTMTVDVAVWGDHPSSAFAAMAAAEQGRSVLLFTDMRQIGTPYTSGLGVIDIGKYGASSRNVGKWFNGLFFKTISRYMGDRWMSRAFSPSFAHQVIQDMLNFYGVRVLTQVELNSVTVTGAAPNKTITKCTVNINDDPDTMDIQATQWIDGSEDADFAAMAGVTFRVGREGVAEHTESYAGFRPHTFNGNFRWQDDSKPAGTPIRGVRKWPVGVSGFKLEIGDPDPASNQPFGWRCALTNIQRNRRRWPKPLNYDREQFKQLFEYRVRAGDGYNYTNPDFIPINPLSFTMHGKVDLNDDSGVDSHIWATADKATRAQIFKDTSNEYFGLRYFLATDADVHDNVRRIMNMWGPCYDEFATSSNSTGVPAGYPYTFYRRGTRRMIKPVYLMTQHDVTWDDPTKEDTIGITLYGMDCHTVSRVAVDNPSNPGWGIWSDGNNAPTIDPTFIVAQAEVPLRCMLDQDFVNICVTNCVGSTFIAYTKMRIDIYKAHQGAVGGLLAAECIRRSVAMRDFVAEPLDTNFLLDNSNAPNGTPPGLQQIIQTLGGVIHPWAAAAIPGILEPDLMQQGQG